MPCLTRGSAPTRSRLMNWRTEVFTSSSSRTVPTRATPTAGSSTPPSDPGPGGGLSMATPRPSFTLLEMVLVLALLVIMAAISLPAINEQYADYRVHAAADQVRARWADARTQAVNEGRAYRFAVVRNRGNFRVAPDSPE